MLVIPEHKARLFRIKPDKIDDEPEKNSPDLIVVQFNPSSLSYTAQNTLEKKGRDAKASQFVSQTSAKLEFDLIFDTTHDGGDVRKETDRIKRFLDTNPENKSKPPSEPAPAMVGFRWGSFKFRGMLESFRETLDFFSAEGVPLRSSVKVSMSALNSSDAFLQHKFTDGDAKAMGGEGVDIGVKLSPVPPGGVPSRTTAAANGMESMRNPGAGLMATASAGVELKAAAAFSAGASAGFGASAGAGFGASAGAGFGASAGAGFGAGAGAGFGASAGAGFGASAGAGFGAGASAGFGASAGAGFGASTGASAGFGASAGAGVSSTSSFSLSSFSSNSFIGSSFSSSGGLSFASASASRGVSASMGAFAGLGPSRTTPIARVAFQFSPPQPAIATASANFSVGGKMIGTASAGLKADVGTNARIRFD